MQLATAPDPIALLETMLRIPSYSGQEGELARYLAQAMQALGLRSHIDEAGNAVGERGEGPVQVVLLGHMDTVPGAIPVRREDDLLYGRGAVDAKGPLAAFIMAAAAVEVPERCRLTVIGATEEEAATSKGARFALLSHSPAAVVIGEPSGWEHVTVGYKGRLLIGYRLERGARHSARDDASVIEEAIGFWGWLKGLAEAYNSGRERRFDCLDCAIREMVSGSDGLHEHVRMELALRLPPGFQVESFQQAARQMAGAAQVEFSGLEQAYRADKGNAVARALVRGIRLAGGEPRFSVKTGTSDMNVVGPAWGCPIAAYGPGDAELDHTPHEHISLTEYRRAIEVLRRALQLLLAELAA